jgi:hypothetical protein
MGGLVILMHATLVYVLVVVLLAEQTQGSVEMTRPPTATVAAEHGW